MRGPRQSEASVILSGNAGVAGPNACSGIVDAIMKGHNAGNGRARRILVLAASREVPARRLSEEIGAAAAQAGTSVLQWTLSRGNASVGVVNKRAASLMNCLTGRCLVEDAISRRGDQTWEIVNGGLPEGEESSLWASDALGQFTSTVSRLFDLILLSDDGERSAQNQDASAGRLAGIVDGVVIVARKGKTRKEDLAQAVAAVKGLPVLGSVMLE